MPSPRDLLNAAKSEIREVTAEDVAARLGNVTLLDVREPDEYEQGALAGAIHVPRGQLEFSIEGRITDKTAPVVVYCAGGTRSAFAAKTLQELGYSDVVSMAGGFNKWKDEGRAWSTPQTMSANQRLRYQRHLLLPEVGEKGQMKLLDSKVLLLGAGGLGSPAACISQPQEWAPLGSSTWTWWMSPTSSVRFCTRWIAWVCARLTAPRLHSPR